LQPNVVVEYNYVDILFSVADGLRPPNAMETLELMQDSLTEEYLDQVVRPIPVFAGAADAFLVSLGGSPTASPSTFTATPTPSLAPIDSTSSGIPASREPSAPSIGPTGGTDPTTGGNVPPSSLPTGRTESPAGGTSAPSTNSEAPAVGTESPAGGTSAPTGASAGEIVLIENTYLAYVSTRDPLTAPTDDQYEQVKELTIAFWEPVLTALPGIGGRFLDTTVDIEFTQLNAGLPMEQFNILMDLASVSVRFEEGTENLPTPDELFVILRDSLGQGYIDNFVTTVTDSAFADLNEAVYLGGMLDPPPEPESAKAGTQPTPIPVVSTPVNGARVRVENWYMAYASIEDPLTEPTEAQYTQMVEQTIAYFEFVVSDFPGIGSSFVSAKAALGSTQLNAGVPADRFNILMRYQYIDLLFADVTENIPSPAYVFELLRASLTKTYITDYVFTVTNSPFAFVNEFVMGESAK